MFQQSNAIIQYAFVYSYHYKQTAHPPTRHTVCWSSPHVAFEVHKAVPPARMTWIPRQFDSKISMTRQNIHVQMIMEIMDLYLAMLLEFHQTNPTIFGDLLGTVPWLKAVEPWVSKVNIRFWVVGAAVLVYRVRTSLRNGRWFMNYTYTCIVCFRVFIFWCLLVYFPFLPFTLLLSFLHISRLWFLSSFSIVFLSFFPCNCFLLGLGW